LRISVVVPVYNSGQFLAQCVESLLSQDYPRGEFELIFVDNGSGDDSREILARYPVTALQESTPGSYAARNCGVRRARGSILAFTDSDCYPVPGWLQTIEDTLARPEALVCMGPRTPPTEGDWLRLTSDYENTKARVIYESTDPLVYFGYTNNMAMRREAMDRCGPFLERMRGSDTIFIRRVVEEFGCRSVVYREEMDVLHAELESLQTYFSKIMTYGQSRRKYRHIKTVRPLTNEERLRVFRETTRSYSSWDSAQLLALLSMGAFAWWAGSMQMRTTER